MYEDIDAILDEVESRRTAQDHIADLEGYLAAVHRYPKLNAAEEIELATKIEMGRAARERLAGGAELSAEDRALLVTSAAEAKKAEETLIESNRRLVASIATRYEATDLSLIDLVQAGNLGLVAAAETFEGQKGFKFSTFATWWIRHAIVRNATGR